MPYGALPAQPAALKRARIAVVAIRNFFMGKPPGGAQSGRKLRKHSKQKIREEMPINYENLPKSDDYRKGVA